MMTHLWEGGMSNDEQGFLLIQVVVCSAVGMNANLVLP